jgi:hypothetical protein
MFGEVRVRMKGKTNRDPVVLASSVPTPENYRDALLHHSPNLDHQWATRRSRELATEFCSEIYDGLGSYYATKAILPDDSIVRFSGGVVCQSSRAGSGASSTPVRT